MLDQNDPHSVVGDGADQPVQLLRFDGVTSGSRFVEQQKDRFGGKRPRNLQPL